MRSKSTIEFLGLWEKLNNPDFKLVDFDQFKNEAGANYFVLSAQKWIESTNAIGLVSKSGRYGGTYAHPDIAFEFASWISVEFKLYLIKEFERLKEQERVQSVGISAATWQRSITAYTPKPSNKTLFHLKSPNKKQVSSMPMKLMSSMWLCSESQPKIGVNKIPIYQEIFEIMPLQPNSSVCPTSKA